MPDSPRFERMTDKNGVTYCLEIETRDRADQLRGMAQAAAGLNANARRRAVVGLIRDGISLGVPSDEVFGLAYDDPSGRQFFTDYFSTQISINELIRVLECLLGERHAKQRLKANDGTDFGPAVAFPTARLRAAIDDAPPELLRFAGGKVAPEPLLRWLLTSCHRDLIHDRLRKFLVEAPEDPALNADGPRSDAPREPTVTDGAFRPRGRKPTVRSHVRAQMEPIAPAILTKMMEKEMEHKFGASRTTCREVRKAVLAERERESNSRQ